ncbi:autotransporter domain-containing protein [Croceicoccus sp. F390]|uniref:Autotransporter domain-containing protein n=1 Tax=Croceicoccus esteveae TaxID=3075597 RepID=A0ABU2ZH58_9SPHN|nr:autotransporter domain-containing protein [Croceicoccus sp. F390]MDT0575934.1 autotransporter domain-containing protein [Croceicoccus sp. F390]
MIEGNAMTLNPLRSSLLVATSTIVLSCAGIANASEGPVLADPSLINAAQSADDFAFDFAGSDYPGIITRDDIDPDVPAPGGSLDTSGINGIGQMVAWNGDGTVGLCTGTLINPRTVIFAAHCVNTRDDTAYGGNTGGTPIGFAFEDDALPSVRAWIRSGFQTVQDSAFYNAEAIWYDERSLDGGFLQADIAIATLDTPAFDIPTWAMLFTPLDGQEHVTVTGYGGRGTNASGNLGIDFRRRTAENYVSLLGSRRDVNAFLFGSSDTYEQNLYFTSFSDPSGEFDDTAGKFDFGIFGDNDVALPREGTTAGGDSGGPLILDEKYQRDVILGVLSGGTRFFEEQSFDGYGTLSFYQPLHAYWQVIVENNPYVYATTQGRIGKWTDPRHWVQAMDPNYVVGLDGKLLSRLPDAPGAENSGEGAKWGDVCFLDDCLDLDQAPVVGATGKQYFVKGGPGSKNFVPNNVTADPTRGIRARYYDVTLNQGTTTLSGADITIDRLTIDGSAKLDIARRASLSTNGDFTQFSGWTNVDGVLDTGEAFLLTGLLTGGGTFRAPFLTSVNSVIDPGGRTKTGTLTIDGDAILASGTTLVIDVEKRSSDLLAVTGTLSLSDPDDASAPGATLFMRTSGSFPRFGQTFTVATADGGVEGTFGNVLAQLGVLRPELNYGETEITATLQALSFNSALAGTSTTATAAAFANALDRLRAGSYQSLSNLYGMVDLMEGATLASTLDALAPQTMTFGQQLQERQSRALFGTVTNRLSMMGGASNGRMTVTGAPGFAFAQPGTAAYEQARRGFAGLTPGQQGAQKLPENFSGFVTGGVITAGNSASASASEVDGARSNYFGMGVEHSLSERFSFGVGVGYANGMNRGNGDQASSRMSQMALYGAYALGGGAYLGLAGNLERMELETGRRGFGGDAGQPSMLGVQDATRMTALAEAGVNVGLTKGLMVTPRVQLGYSRNALSGMQETGGDAALAFDKLTTNRVDTRLGAKFSGTQAIGNGWSITPQFEADYIHVLDGADAGMTVRFAAADYIPIALPLAGGDTSWGELKGGLSIGNNIVTFGAGVETAFGRDAMRYDRAMADISIRF